MAKRMVRCSMPGCQNEATTRFAAPWEYGRFHELKTYGYACEGHKPEVLERVQARPRPGGLDEGESLGEVGEYPVSA